MSATLAGLLAGLVSVPPLPDAACRGLWSAFDAREAGEATDDWHYRAGAAVAICQRCPALPRCTDWLTSTPPARRPRGVVAGVLVDGRGVIRTARRLAQAVAS